MNIVGIVCVFALFPMSDTLLTDTMWSATFKSFPYIKVSLLFTLIYKKRMAHNLKGGKIKSFMRMKYSYKFRETFSLYVLFSCLFPSLVKAQLNWAELYYDYSRRPRPSPGTVSRQTSGLPRKLKGPVSGFVGHIPLPSLDSIITRNH